MNKSVLEYALAEAKHNILKNLLIKVPLILIVVFGIGIYGLYANKLISSFEACYFSSSVAFVIFIAVFAVAYFEFVLKDQK